jgi:hypothetical protein
MKTGADLEQLNHFSVLLCNVQVNEFNILATHFFPRLESCV